MTLRSLPSRVAASLLTLLSHLPLAVHYVLSDIFIYPLVYYILRYRRRVVRRNMRASFPDWTDGQLRQTERRFYHWFSDMLVETLKAHTISLRTLRSRVEYRGTELLEKAAAEGHDFICCYLSHYATWEWCVGFPYERPELTLCQIYHPLENAVFNDWSTQSRERFRAVCIPMRQTLRRLLQLRKAMQEGSLKGHDGQTAVKGMVFGCIADQVPTRESIHLRLPFLHQDTAVFTGCEKLGRQLGMSFCYAQIERPRRGHYIVSFQPLTPTAEEAASDFAYTRAYFRRLEADIQAHPHLWLWTHNRWKR